MGFLHEGHLSLIRRCRKENDCCILSIFVNPAQFGPKENFGTYPQNNKRDELFAKNEKVDIIFYPSAEEIYPKNYLTFIEVDQLGALLCGRRRPRLITSRPSDIAALLALSISTNK